MTQIHTLASGSSGNAALFSCGGVHLLVDAGISCRRIAAALGELGLAPADLAGILITHTHTDHIAGLETLLKRCAAPVFASYQAADALTYRFDGLAERLYPFSPGGEFQVDGCTVSTFPTSHDSPGSAGYRVGELGLLTDSGCVTDCAAETLAGVRVLVLEANHDVSMLTQGSYPYYLKRRILSDTGHLSNDAAARFAVEMAARGTEQLVLAHLSAENNTPALAAETVGAALEEAALHPGLSVAPRATCSDAYCVREGVSCKR